MRRCVPPKRRAFSELRGVTTQKIALFTVIAVVIPNPTQCKFGLRIIGIDMYRKRQGTKFICTSVVPLLHFL
jgi:hypothetical protein